MADQKNIAVSKETHKELAIRKIKKEYSSFEEMLVTEILEAADE